MKTTERSAKAFVSELQKPQDIFYIDPSKQSQKPWRSEQVDSSQYFNYGFNQKSWDKYRQRIINRYQILQKIQRQTDEMKDNKFKPIDTPHHSLDYNIPIQFGGMGHFYFKRFLYENLHSYPQEQTDYTPTLKSHKTQNGEQFCYLAIERRQNHRAMSGGSLPFPSDTYDIIKDKLQELMPDSDQDNEDDDEKNNNFTGMDRNMYGANSSQRIVGSGQGQSYFDQPFDNRYQGSNFGGSNYRQSNQLHERYDRRENSYNQQYRGQVNEDYNFRKHRNSIDFEQKAQKRFDNSYKKKQASRMGQNSSKYRSTIQDDHNSPDLKSKKESHDSYYKKRRHDREDKSQEQNYKKTRKFSQQNKNETSQRTHRSHRHHHHHHHHRHSNQKEQQERHSSLRRENSDRKEQHHRKHPQPPLPGLQKSQSSRSQKTSSQSPKKQPKASEFEDAKKQKTSQKQKEIAQAKKRLTSRPPPKYQPDQSEQERIKAEVQKNAQTHRRMISEKQKQSSQKDQRRTYTQKSPVKDLNSKEQKRAQKIILTKRAQQKSLEVVKRNVSKMYGFDSPEEIGEASKSTATFQKRSQDSFDQKNRQRKGNESQDNKKVKVCYTSSSGFTQQQKSIGLKGSIKQNDRNSEDNCDIEKRLSSSSKDKKKKHRNHKHRHHHRGDKHGKQSSTLNSIQQESQREEGEIYSHHAAADHSQMKRHKHKHKKDKRVEKAQKSSSKMQLKYE